MTLLLLLSLSACRSDKDNGDSGLYADQDGDGSTAIEDCDDTNALIFPGNAEVCDGLDNDCDGLVDNEVGSDWYKDADTDGYGGAEVLTACEQPIGYVATSTDCDDADNDTYPGAPERCDGVDQDCDGVADNDVLSIWYADGDGDRYGDAAQVLEECDPPDGYVADGSDCDDTVPTTHPGAVEVCNGVDDDCDGDTDEELEQDWYADIDGDLYGDPGSVVSDCEQPSGYVSNNTDCDDSSPKANPGGTESCDILDNDCDGDVDEGVELDFYLDSDGDGYGSTSSTTGCEAPSGYVDNKLDCDDGDSATNPDTLWYIDYDGDSYGSSAYTTASCTQPSGYVSDSTDCDDAVAAVYPGATESCDAVDNDCDSTVDEEPSDGTTYYADVDGDGFGDPAADVELCADASGYTTDNTDCDDAEATAYPGSTSTEVPGDSIDQNCDGNDGCSDLDCDGLPDMVIADYRNNTSYNTSVWLYYNDGGGYSDADRDALTAAYGVYDVAVEDLDGDGYQDVIGASYYDGNYNTNSYIWWGSSTGYSDTDSTTLQTYGARRLLVKDLDADGYEELIFANYYNGSSYSVDSYVYWGSVSGYSTSARTDLETLGAMRVEAEDLDADGYEDLVFCNYYDGSSYSINSYVYWGSSTGYSTSDRTSTPTIGCRDIELEDFDGDGNTDIAFGSYRRSSTAFNGDSYVYYQTTAGSFSTGSRDAFTTRGVIGVSSGDFDADGTQDLVFNGYYNGDWSNNAYTYVYMNSSSGYSTSSPNSLGGRGNYGSLVADLDGDGYDDLISARYRSNSTNFTTNSLIWSGSSAGLSDSNRQDIPTSGASYAAVGDVDGNGVPEIIFGNYRGDSAVNASSYVYFGSTSATWDSSARDSLSTKGSWAAPVLVGDVSW